MESKVSFWNELKNGSIEPAVTDQCSSLLAHYTAESCWNAMYTQLQ